MKKENEIKRDVIKNVLTTNSFEYSNNVEKKLINERGTINLSFGMRCFFWIAFSMLFVLFLNVIIQNTRVKNAVKGIVVDVQNEFADYEENFISNLKTESKFFKDPILVEKLNNDPRRVISILVNKQNETDSAYYLKNNGEAYKVEDNNFSKVTMDSVTYDELEKLLNQDTDLVQSTKWYYDKSLHKYKKLAGYKVYNSDGTCNGIIVYANAIANPLNMITHICTNANMKFYVYDRDKNLIYTNNEDEKTIEAVNSKVNNEDNSAKVIVMKANEEKKEAENSVNDEKIKKNKHVGFGMVQLSRNVGSALKNETFGSSIINYYDVTGYTVILDYKSVTNDIARNLIFFYAIGLMIILAILYVMTYFYKYTKVHGKLMLNTVMWSLITSLIITIIFQMVSYINSTKNLAMVQAGILADAFNTNVTEEQYIEYAAFINHVDLDTELESGKDKIAKTFAEYYKKTGVEGAEVTIYTKPSYISEGIKQIINSNGVFVRLRKSGGERYLNFESVKTGKIRGKDIWIKLAGTIEAEISNKCKTLVKQFGNYDAFEVIVGDKAFRLDANNKYYVQTESNLDVTKSESNVEVEKTFFTTKTWTYFDGYAYVVKYTSSEFAVIFIIIGIIVVIIVCAYFNITSAMSKLKDEDVQDNKYKHLLAEWLSGNITVINESEKDRSAEYDEILLDRLRKTNIERQSRVKKEEEINTDADEDEIYQKVKKEKDIFGISLFKHKKARIAETSAKNEFVDESQQTNITELKETIVSSIQNKETKNEEVHDTEKLKVTEERLAIQEVLEEIEVQKNAKGDEAYTIDEDKDDLFSEELQLLSKDEKYDQKFEKK